MQLMFRTRNGTRCLEWAHYALLRDNVEHYLESGPEHCNFKALHGVERAEDGEVRYLRALELRREIQRAWMALSRLKLADCAISLKTHALLSGSAPPFVHGTFPAKANGWLAIVFPSLPSDFITKKATTIKARIGAMDRIC